MKQSIYYDFGSYLTDFSKVVYSIEKAGTNYDMVVGVVRGGLVPAVHMSHALGAQFCTLNWSTRDGIVEDRQNFRLKSALEKGRRVLLVDDICDTGATLDDITKAYPGMDTAVLVYDKDNKRGFVPTYFGWERDDEDKPWVAFWWEQK